MQDITLERKSKGSVAMGVVLIIIGTVAVISPLFAALVLIRVIGWLLIFAGIEQAIHAFRTSEGGVFLKVVLAVVYAVVGGLLLRNPASGAVATTAIIGFLLIADGVVEIALGVQLRGLYTRSGWLFAGGILSLSLGALILYRLPWSLVAVGMLVGFRLIFKGIEQIARSSAETTTRIERERRAA